jgi:hypothetical protein
LKTAIRDAVVPGGWDRQNVIDRRKTDIEATALQDSFSGFSSLGNALEFLAVQAGNLTASSLSDSLREFAWDNPSSGRPINAKVKAQAKDFGPDENTILRWYKDRALPESPYFQLLKDYFRRAFGAAAYRVLEPRLNVLFSQAVASRRQRRAAKRGPSDSG